MQITTPLMIACSRKKQGYINSFMLDKVKAGNRLFINGYLLYAG